MTLDQWMYTIVKQTYSGLILLQLHWMQNILLLFIDSIYSPPFFHITRS